MSEPERTSPRVRVGLVDDHDVVGIALEHALRNNPTLEFTGMARTVDDLLGTRSISLAVLDLRLADGSSPVRNVERLAASGVGAVAYTSAENPYLVRLVARSPILGIERKSAPLGNLIETLERAAAGATVMSPDWAAAMDSDPALARAGLSPKEQEVLALFATGFKAQAVASQAGVAVPTVDDYVRRIRAKYAKVGRPAYTKVDLYKRAIEDGFLPLPDGGR